ncbi:hypothetical protein RFI_33290, partial [Reticulomyxa filosa]
MIYNIRRHCNIIPRILVSSSHYNVPVWGDLLFKMGGAPRTRHCANILMELRETIIMFASRRDEQNNMSILQGQHHHQHHHATDGAGIGAGVGNGINIDTDREKDRHKRNSNAAMYDARYSAQFRDMYFDLAKKYNYVVIPAVCVSTDDVVEMVYNLPNDRNQLSKKFKSLRTISQPF